MNASPSQFPEVVYLIRHDQNGKEARCSGTVIAPNWILTAAHCLIDGTATATLSGSPGRDYEYPHPENIEIRADNAFSLEAGQRGRRPQKAIAWAGYKGGAGTVPNDGDLALVRFAEPYPAANVPPDRLAGNGQFSPISSSAGFGYANTSAGDVDGKFNVSWPPDLTGPTKQDPSPSFLTFGMVGNKVAQTNGAFCQGDSGGPVFVGRNRGCRPADQPEGEARPRVIQGINVWDAFGIYDSNDPVAKQWVDSCLSSSVMRVGSIMVPQRHTWICKIAEQTPAGCP